MLAGLADNVNEIGSVRFTFLLFPLLLMSTTVLVWVYALRSVVSRDKAFVHLCVRAHYFPSSTGVATFIGEHRS